MKASTELNIVKEPLEESLRQLTIRGKECQELESEILGLSGKGVPLISSTSYVDVIMKNMHNGERIVTKPSGNHEEYIKKYNMRTMTEPSNKNRDHTSVRKTQPNRYQNLFFGYCYSCNNFGHKIVDCRAQLKRNYKKLERTN